MMNARTKLLLIALAAIPVVAVAAEEPKLSCIKDVTYSQEFLARWPNAGAACREVVMKDGDKWVRYTTRVVEVKDGKHLVVETLNVSDDVLGTITFAPTSDASVNLNGKDVKFTSLRRGDRIDFWLAPARVDYYYASTPGAPKLKAWPVVSVERTLGK